jgi:hypothetical protein
LDVADIQRRDVVFDVSGCGLVSLLSLKPLFLPCLCYALYLFSGAEAVFYILLQVCGIQSGSYEISLLPTSDTASVYASSFDNHPPFFTVHLPSPPCRLIGIVEIPVPSTPATSSSLSSAAAAAASAGATLVNDGSSPWSPIGSSISGGSSGVITILHVTLLCDLPYASSVAFQ